MEKSVHSAYREAQLINSKERNVAPHDLLTLTDNWKKSDLPALQRSVVDIQLAQLALGDIDPVFLAFQTALQRVPLDSFRLLDAACATGYYHEVLRKLDNRPISYLGSDYSAAMIDFAQRRHPTASFVVQDLTQLNHGDREFEVVLAAGVLEHVPHYPNALAELTRVAGEYLIVHRSPFHSGGGHRFTIGSQYSIETPRIFFSLGKFREELEAFHFELVDTIEVYRPSVSERLRRALSRNRAITLTLVFRRRDASSL